MNILNIGPTIETVTAIGARTYVFASEIFTVTALLWGLKMMAGLIETTYNVGYQMGLFYKKYLHHHVIALIAYLILVGEWVYEHRQEIKDKAFEMWHNLEKAFVYESPLLPVCE